MHVPLNMTQRDNRLLSAFAELSSRFPDWNLAIVGEGRSRRELENQVAKLGLEKRAFLIGAVGNIADWYEQADLYVLTSRFEGFPNALAEALAYGLPAVSVDCETGPRDILRHEVDGLLVPEGDQQALIESLQRLMADQDLRHLYSARAIEARDRFALERTAAMWDELFTQVTC